MSLSPTTENKDVNILAPSYKEANVFFVNSVNALYTRLENHVLTPNTLIRLEQPFTSLNLLKWLEYNNAYGQASYWSNRDKSYVISGIGCAIKLQASNNLELPRLFNQIKNIIKGCSARFVGGIAFSEEAPENNWKGFPYAQFILPEIEISYKEKQFILAVNLFEKDLSQLKLRHQQCLKRLKMLRFTDLSSPVTSSLGLPKPKILKREDIPLRAQWKKNVATALSSIKSKELTKIVLSRDTELTFNTSISAFQLLDKWQNADKKGFLFCIQSGHSTFLGNSPEQLYLKEHSNLSTEAIAGTVPRGTSSLNDSTYEQQLLNSPKLIQEHQVVVDYLTHQLNDICCFISNIKPLSIIKLANVQHLKTSFKARLKPNITDSDIILKLHPTPAVCGQPFKDAMAMIDQLEHNNRGWYAGLVGTLSENETEFCVAIRSVLLKNKTAHCYSGVGLVDGSEEASEWDELNSKIQTILSLFKV